MIFITKLISGISMQNTYVVTLSLKGNYVYLTENIGRELAFRDIVTGIPT
jgi:hypothetical protein